jgi:hypothetical protein
MIRALPVEGFPHMSVTANRDPALLEGTLAGLRSAGFKVETDRIVPPAGARAQVIAAISAAFQSARGNLPREVGGSAPACASGGPRHPYIILRSIQTRTSRCATSSFPKRIEPRSFSRAAWCADAQRRPSYRRAALVMPHAQPWACPSAAGCSCGSNT